MSTLAEIEKAIEKLPPEQWQEIRRWMECHAPKAGAEPRTGEPADFDRWLAASTGIAKGRFTTDERMRETRGED
jgi:6-phosphofructokinase